MPYIKQEQREKIVETMHRGVVGQVLTPYKVINMENIHLSGELNFAITMLINDWLEKNGVNYSEINTVMGVLECVKQEFYRRMAAPYETNKARENGDVFRERYK